MILKLWLWLYYMALQCSVCSSWWMGVLKVGLGKGSGVEWRGEVVVGVCPLNIEIPPYIHLHVIARYAWWMMKKAQSGHVRKDITETPLRIILYFSIERFSESHILICIAKEFTYFYLPSQIISFQLLLCCLLNILRAFKYNSCSILREDILIWIRNKFILSYIFCTGRCYVRIVATEMNKNPDFCST